MQNAAMIFYISLQILHFFMQRKMAAGPVYPGAAAEEKRCDRQERTNRRGQGIEYIG